MRTEPIVGGRRARYGEDDLACSTAVYRGHLAARVLTPASSWVSIGRVGPSKLGQVRRRKDDP